MGVITRTRCYPKLRRGSLEYRYRIAVDGHAQLRRSRDLEPPHEVAHDRCERRGMVALEQHVPTPAALDAVDRTRRRSDERHPIAGAGIDEAREPFRGA